jgi:hypothetical protein
MCKTSNIELDKIFDTWVATVGESLLIDISKLLFTPNNEKLLEERLLDSNNGVYYALVTYLITNRIYDNPPENTVSNLSRYNKNITSIKEYSGTVLFNNLYNYNKYISTDLLIKKQSDRVITVIGDVYNKYIKQGGNDAALFGNLLSNDRKIYMRDICENQLKYIESWESHNRFLNMSIQSKSFIKKKEALHRATYSIVTLNFDHYFGHLCNEGVLPTIDMKEYVEYVRLLDVTISDLREMDFINIWSLATKIVCTCIFHYTDSKKLLESVDAAMRVNNLTNGREALLIATIEYVADYVAESITVSNYNA